MRAGGVWGSGGPAGAASAAPEAAETFASVQRVRVEGGGVRDEPCHHGVAVCINSENERSFRVGVTWRGSCDAPAPASEPPACRTRVEGVRVGRLSDEPTLHTKTEEHRQPPHRQLGECDYWHLGGGRRRSGLPCRARGGLEHTAVTRKKDGGRGRDGKRACVSPRRAAHAFSLRALWAGVNLFPILTCGNTDRFNAIRIIIRGE